MSEQIIDAAAFERLVIEHQAALYRVARSILKDDQDAEDAVQEAVCLAYANRDRLRDSDKWKQWVLRILVNTCYSAYRKKRPTVDLTEIASYVPAPTVDVNEKITLWDTVLQLPKEMQSVVVLFYYEDLTVRQISKVLKLSEGTVRTRLSRARERLRNMLDAE